MKTKYFWGLVVGAVVTFVIGSISAKVTLENVKMTYKNHYQKEDAQFELEENEK